MIERDIRDQPHSGDGFSSTPSTIEDSGGGNVINFPPREGNVLQGVGVANFPPPNTTTTPETTTHEPDDFERFADVLGRIVGSGIYVPTNGDPIAVPTASRTTKSLPLIIIIVSLAIMGYLYYKKHTSRGRLAVENE